MGFNSGFKGLLLYIEDTFPFPLGHEQNVHLEGHAIYCSIESPFTIPISLSSASSATSSFPYTLNDLHILRHFLRVTFIDPSKRASCQHPSTPFPTLPPWRQRKQILPKCWLSIYQTTRSHIPKDHTPHIDSRRDLGLTHTIVSTWQLGLDYVTRVMKDETFLGNLMTSFHFSKLHSIELDM